MRKILLVLLLALALVVLTASAAYADYWPPSELVNILHGVV